MVKFMAINKENIGISEVNPEGHAYLLAYFCAYFERHFGENLEVLL
jgi:hypothetical protein